jgi:hypothetical protein
MVDELKVVDGLLRCYERKDELWKKMRLIDEEIRSLRGMVSEKLLKEKGI